MTAASDIAPHLDTWRQHLLDTTKRNRLVSFKSGRVGGVDLFAPAAARIWERLVVAGEKVRFPWKRDLLNLPAEVVDTESLIDDPPTDGTPFRPAVEELSELAAKSPRFQAHHVVTPHTDKFLAARLNRLALTAREAQADQGVNVLYAAFGFLKWFESDDSDEEIFSPLLLVPVRLDRDGVAAEWELSPEEDERRTNDTLAETLRSQFKIALPEVDDEDETTWFARHLPAVRERVKAFKRWEVLERAALGVFNFQKLAMWEDLERNRARIEAHPLCRALAGDAAALPAPPDGVPNPDELDQKVPPQDVSQILDADSSQQAAIEAVKRGSFLVLDGPPGTGKSQTIANMIAEALAVGRTVLFVSEKTAALDVVKRRLDACGLGDFCLELHSHRSNRKEIVQELGRCMKLGREVSPDAADDLRRLAETRELLNAYVRELHRPRPPLNRSAFQAHGELARLESLPSRSRLVIADVRNKDAAYLDRVGRILAGLIDCRAVFAADAKHPWRGSKVAAWSGSLQDDIKFHLSRLNQLAPAAEGAVAALASLGFGEPTGGVTAWHDALADARAVLAVPVCPKEWFTADTRAAAEGVVFLADAGKRHRDFAAAAPELSVDALRRADPTAFKTPPTVSLVGGYPGLVRELVIRLRDARDRLAAVVTTATTADAAAKAVAGSLKLGETGATADELAAFAALGAVPAAWAEAGRRQELLAVVGRCAENRRASRAIRAELAACLSPLAFAPESAPLATRGARYTSFFARLFPGWWSLKSQLKEWYAGGAPGGAAVVADMGKLAAYHSHAAHAKQIAEVYPADIRKGDDGPDWDATLERLQAVGRVVTPTTSRDALANLTKLDAAKVTREIGDLKHAEGELRAACDSLARVYEAGSHLALPAKEIAARAVAQLRGVETTLAAFEQLVGVLSAGADVETANAPNRFTTAAGWAKLLADAERARAAAGFAGDFPAALARDWQGERTVAGRLLEYLKGRSTPLNPGHVAGFTDANARDAIATSIRASEEVAANGFADSWGFVTGQLFDPSADVSTGVVLGLLPIPELPGWCRERVADSGRLLEWVRFGDAQRDATAAGVGGIFDEIRRGEVTLDHAADAYRARFFRQWLDAIDAEVPELRRFAAEDHERTIAQFRDLDRRAMRTAALRTRAALLGAPTRPGQLTDAPATSEVGILLREVEKARRHLPLRKLFAKIPTVLPRVKPCLMMSPLAVSTYLQSPELVFDLVVFDEASQVRPHDAVCAIYRGKQVVVAGDQKQLPPTSFFERGADDEPANDSEGISDYESVLDVCCSIGLPRRRLRWHYRSRREGLIAFSNHHFYDNQLVTFPSARDVAGSHAVAFHHVPDGRFADGENVIEARVVAQLVLDHFESEPTRTLGVIAFSQRQQFRILDELEILRKERTELEEFFRPDRDDAFFVKNLENVQGDERDVIFLSVGYGPNAAGKILMNFGPLNRKGGERRLNVAVTRARWAMTVVSSIKAGDIVEARTEARGARLLKAYLDFAEHGPDALKRIVTEANVREFDSPFEKEVCDELTRRGLTVHRQVGCGGFRVDLGVLDPNEPGRYLLGVECDGATYHTSATARDRDRLRQDILEGLGWRVCRVWSTDWVKNRSAQVQRVLDAVKRSKEAPATLPPPPPPPMPAKAVPAKEVKPVEFASIDAVPTLEIERLMMKAVTQFGGTGVEDLLKRVSKQLGFKKLGPNIKSRLAGVLNELVQAGQFRIADERIWVAS